MNYDGPSFYKKRKSTPDSAEYKKDTQQANASLTDRKEMGKNSGERSSHRFFRSKQIPRSLQTLEGWEKAKRNEPKIQEVAARLQKKREDYLIFADYSEEETAEEQKSKKETPEKEKVAFIQKKVKSDRTKPSSGLHRTLSKIIDDDAQVLKNGKHNLESLFSDESL